MPKKKKLLWFDFILKLTTKISTVTVPWWAVKWGYDAALIHPDVVLDGGARPSVTAVARVHVTFLLQTKQKSPCASPSLARNCTFWHKSLISMHVVLINLCMQMEHSVSQNQSTGDQCMEAAQVVWQKIMNETRIRFVGGKQISLQTFYFLSFFKILTRTTRELTSCSVQLHSQSEWRMIQTTLGNNNTKRNENSWSKSCNHNRIWENQPVYRNKMCFGSVCDSLQNIIISKVNCIFLNVESNIITMFFVYRAHSTSPPPEAIT